MLCYSSGTTNGTTNGSVQPRFSTGSSSDVITSISNGLSATHLVSHTPHNNAVAIEDMIVVMKPRPMSGEMGASGNEEGDNDSVESGFSEQDADPLEAL